MEILDLFGSLIGNTDKHHGNIAVAWTFERRYRLLDSDDMLPMLYRPNIHGQIVERERTPAYPGAGGTETSAEVPRDGIAILGGCIGDARISDAFKVAAERHVRALRALASAASIEASPKKRDQF